MLVIFKEYKDIQNSWKDARTQADMNHQKKKKKKKKKKNRSSIQKEEES